MTIVNLGGFYFSGTIREFTPIRKKKENKTYEVQFVWNYYPFEILALNNHLLVFIFATLQIILNFIIWHSVPLESRQKKKKIANVYMSSTQAIC